MREYVGARYVPQFYDGAGNSCEWVPGVAYEALTIVTHLNNSYTSKKPVPAGIDIMNEEYWANTGNYNAQVEQYRQDTLAVKESIKTLIIKHDNVADMISDSSLKTGDIVKTAGYYKFNDLGSAFYQIKGDEPTNYYEILSNGLYAELMLNGCATPEMFGARGDGVADDTDAIQNAINHVNKVILNNRYKVSKRYTADVGAYGKFDYALVIPGYKEIVNYGTIVVDSLIKVFFTSSTYIKLKGGNYEFSVTDARYKTGVIGIYNTYGLSISNIISNAQIVQCFTSKEIVVDTCTFFRNLSDNVGAIIGLYNTNYCVINNNTINGSSNDGDIGAFGNSSFNVFSNNKLDALNVKTSLQFLNAQGIFIDAQGRNNQINNNSINGYYYGVDIKAYSNNNIVEGNILTRCKVSVALRQGEQPGGTQSNTVTNNIFDIKGGNGNTSVINNINNFDVINVGVLINQTASCLISENIFQSSIISTDNACGILIQSSNDTSLTAGDININNNEFITTINTLGTYTRILGYFIATPNSSNAISRTLNVINNKCSCGGINSGNIFINQIYFLNFKGNIFNDINNFKKIILSNNTSVIFNDNILIGFLNVNVCDFNNNSRVNISFNNLEPAENNTFSALFNFSDNVKLGGTNNVIINSNSGVGNGAIINTLNIN